MTDDTSPPSEMTMQRSSRDPTTVPDRVAAWLATELPEGAGPAVVLHSGIDANGLSSETLVLDVTWNEAGQRRTGAYVARVQPAAEDVPLFPEYRLDVQYDVMRTVAEHTDVPVPAVHWFEPTGEVLGTPFFLMDRVEGEIPPDVLPYNFGDNWLFDAGPGQQRRVQQTTIEVLARLHQIPDPARTFPGLAPDPSGGTALERNLAAARAWYDYAVPGAGRSVLVERALDWLAEHLPTTDEQVLCWGDARIGNVLYRDFEPVGVLDWEMVTLGPRELDVSWLVFAHRVFESITDAMGMPGMPDFLTEDDVRETYRRLTGVELGDLRWYHLYNATLWCIIFMRTGTRQIHFGEIEPPAEVEELFHHRLLMEHLLDEAGA